jgi:UDP-N-acetyl-D-mannosaminuronic acid dehydrogenase
MGLSFKPDIDDLRESPALFITRRLITEGMDVLAVEPNIDSFKEFSIVDTAVAVMDADVVIFLVKHKAFQYLKVTDKVVLDFCNVTNF